MYIIVYLLKNKFEVFDKVIQYKNLIKNQIKKIQIQRFDNGGNMVETFKWISSTNIVKQRNSKKLYDKYCSCHWQSWIFIKSIKLLSKKGFGNPYLNIS